MPKLKFSLPGDERYNTLMSVVALLQRVGEMHIDELSAHFEVPKVVMRAMLATLNTTSFMPRNSEEQLPFYIDLERVDDEDGIVALDLDEGPVGVPRISSSQSVAILAGLEYLQSIPEFSASTELVELREILGSGISSVPNISVEKPKLDGDLAILQRAILTDRRIQCRYVNGRGEESTREIDPIVLVSEDEHWYLRGYCLIHDEVRTFRLDHMVDAQLLEIARGANALEAAQRLDLSAPIYSPSSHDIEVTLELAPEAYPLLGLGAVPIDAKDSSGEKMLVSIRLGYLPDLGPLVCRYGSHVRVVSPESAKSVVRAYAEQILSRNYLASEAE
jgi:proteasome accessory factor C